MARFAFTALLLLPALLLHAQQSAELEENKPYQYNGFEYGYSITNEKSKEVKGDDYDRYEISIYVSNRSGYLKLIPLSVVSDPAAEEIPLAEFSCRNATGKRLTAKNGKVNAKPWFTQVRAIQDNPSKKLVKAQVGFAIANGQTVSTKIIVIVPKGERPKLTVRTVYYPEFI
jgi:hypothetical protein